MWLFGRQFTSRSFLNVHDLDMNQTKMFIYNRMTTSLLHVRFSTLCRRRQYIFYMFRFINKRGAQLTLWIKSLIQISQVEHRDACLQGMSTTQSFSFTFDICNAKKKILFRSAIWKLRLQIWRFVLFGRYQLIPCWGRYARFQERTKAQQNRPEGPGKCFILIIISCSRNMFL